MFILIILVSASISVEGRAAQEVVNDEILLDPITITAMIQTNGSTTILIDIRVSNMGTMTIQEVSIRIDSLEVKVVSAASGGLVTETSTEQMERHTMIRVDLQQELSVNESVWLNLKLQSTDMQSYKEVGINQDFLNGGFVFYMRPHTTLTNFTFIAILPSHTSLSHDSAIPIFPQADANFTNGESIAFIWYMPSLQPGQESVFIVRYQELIVSTIDGEVSVLTVSFVGILGVFIGIGATIAAPGIWSRLKRTKVIHYHGVSIEEEMIIESIKSKGGSCSQKELYQQLNIGESRLSLILTGLEERGFVKRFREGRENIVNIVEV